ncbi:MAG: SDR family oxidoreductase [Actinomycetota bacterium]|nr:SDR family oxidoreductase [Actinomycetota bacterium]
MAYFVTGGTGFIGRRLVEELLGRRRGTIFVLVRDISRDSFDRLHRTRWRSSRRVIPVAGDLTAPQLGVAQSWIDEHRLDIRHFFHLAALYDMTASAERNETLNVGGTRGALDLASALEAGTFHQMSSVAVAGDYLGVFDETMFDQGQELPSPYHRTKFEAERVVRRESTVPWRIYRPAMVLGHSETGAMDKIDGPYYFFPLLKRLRDSLPQWAPLVGLDLGDTNVVPVDYVVKAMNHLAHAKGLDGRTFHLVHPDPQPTIDVVNTFATAAKAPTFAVPVQRRFTSALPPQLTPVNLLTSALRTPAAQGALHQTVGRLGVPPEVLGHLSPTSTYTARHTEHALEGSGIACPDLDSYAAALWDYWEQHLDPSTAHDPSLREALVGTKVVITGASSGIGKATALKVAQAGGVPLLVARGKDKLLETQGEIEAAGGVAHSYPCDLTDLDAIDKLTARLVGEHDAIGFVVNNAGRSIRRSLSLSTDRFHDFERTMQLNYFGAIRLVMGLLPVLKTNGSGHVVNISSIGVQTNPPRFSAYVASKAALDAWSRVVAAELVGDGVTFTTIHMPLVRTPMIAPTKIYDAFPTITPAQAADLVMSALKDRPHEINTALGTAGEVVHALVPKAAFRILHMAYRIFPDSAVAKGDSADEDLTAEQRLLARILKGVYW